MSLKSKTILKKDPLKEKIKRNPKYQDVKPVVDTGASVTRFARRLAELSHRYRFRKDEIFKRIKISTFVELVLQVIELERDVKEARALESERSLELDFYSNRVSARSDAEDSSHRRADADAAIEGGESTRSGTSLQSVIAGLGELDVKRGRTLAPSPLRTNRAAIRNHNATSGTWWKLHADSHTDSFPEEREGDEEGYEVEDEVEEELTDSVPYLLLDVRDREEFETAHMRTAVSYPAAMLSRSVNAELASMHSFRNAPGRIIVLYDSDESVAPRVATALVQRGYDNLFVLSGGLRLADKLFPDGLLIVAGPGPRPGPAPGPMSTSRSRSRSRSKPEADRERDSQHDFDDDAVAKLRAALDAHLLHSSNGSSMATTRNTSRNSLASTSRTSKTPFTSRSLFK